MTTRRLIAAVLSLCMLSGCAIAQNVVPGETTAAVCMPADMTPEEIQLFIEALFAAAVGTTVEQELVRRKGMTEEEIEARNAENAEYRAKTIPWLKNVFNPEILSEEFLLAHGRLSTPQDAPEQAPIQEGEAAEMPAYTPQDSYAAFGENEKGMEYLALMKSIGGDSWEKCLLATQDICKIWMAQVNHEVLTDMNDDYRCWIYSAETQIDYPVVQGENNSYYLKRMFNGERNSAGTLFMDYRNLPDFQDPNTLIYGHHMRNNSMFGTLTDYAKQEYYEGHPILLVMRKHEIFLLEVFAGYTTSDKDHCYDIAISDEEDMSSFIDEAVHKSDFVSGVQVKTTDRIVTLSTCAYAFEDARYILIGKIVPVWEKDMDVSKNTELEN